MSIPLQTPSKCTLVHDPKRERINDEQVAMIVKCILHNDQPKNLHLHYTSGLLGRDGDEWVEFEADNYRLAAYVRGGFVTNIFYALSPSSKEFYLPQDSGNPFLHLSIDEQQKLQPLLLPPSRKTVEVVPAWIIAVNGARPYAASLFYDKDEATAAAKEQMGHYERYNTPQLTEKGERSKESKKQNIAFKPKGKRK